MPPADIAIADIAAADSTDIAATNTTNVASSASKGLRRMTTAHPFPLHHAYEDHHHPFLLRPAHFAHEHHRHPFRLCPAYDDHRHPWLRQAHARHLRTARSE